MLSNVVLKNMTFLCFYGCISFYCTPLVHCPVVIWLYLCFLRATVSTVNWLVVLPPLFVVLAVLSYLANKIDWLIDILFHSNVWNVGQSRCRPVNSRIYFTQWTHLPATFGISPFIIPVTHQVHAYAAAMIRLSWVPVGIVHCRHYVRVGAWWRHFPLECGVSSRAMSSRPVIFARTSSCLWKNTLHIQ